MEKDKWNELLKIIDEKKPFFKVEFVRGLEFIEIKNQKEEEIRECRYCGQPTDQEICGVCKIKAKFALL